MLNQFVDFRVVTEKIEDALMVKYRAMFPRTLVAWHEYLAEFGISADSTKPPEGRFMRVSDPMGTYVFNMNGDAAGARYSVLYVPEEVAEKILVLGRMP